MRGNGQAMRVGSFAFSRASRMVRVSRYSVSQGEGEDAGAIARHGGMVRGIGLFCLLGDDGDGDDADLILSYRVSSPDNGLRSDIYPVVG